MFSKLLFALPFSQQKSTPKETSNSGGSGFKFSGLGKQIKRALGRPHPKRKNKQHVKPLISPPIKVLQTSTMIASSRIQVNLEDPSVFENPRPLHHPLSSTPDQPGASLHNSTTEGTQTSSPPSLAGLGPSQWLGQGREEPKPRSWNSEHEAEMLRLRYSANSKELTELAEESAFIKWDGLFSPSPEDNQRQGRRARARGIKTWTGPPAETMIKEEPPVRRPTSALLPTCEREIPRRRRPQNRGQLW
ncbi:hypothetical protein FS837_003546 [Tulasnella sp. UAMH 9824]|nr:hypothetical protein FS837_003546 [Tulasnella sp. UAMH 9824]